MGSLKRSKDAPATCKLRLGGDRMVGNINSVGEPIAAHVKERLDATTCDSSI